MRRALTLISPHGVAAVKYNWEKFYSNWTDSHKGRSLGVSYIEGVRVKEATARWMMDLLISAERFGGASINLSRSLSAEWKLQSRIIEGDDGRVVSLLAGGVFIFGAWDNLTVVMTNGALRSLIHCDAQIKRVGKGMFGQEICCNVKRKNFRGIWS